MNYIFDIDNTLADCSHRLHFIQGENKDWDSFHKACVDDEPIEHNIRLLNHLMDTATYARDEIEFYFLTARPESSRKSTLGWLIDNTGVIASKETLLMRKDKDHREDWVIKLEHLNNLNLDKSQTIIFDDRDQVVQNLRANGWIVFQVCNGTY